MMMMLHERLSEWVKSGYTAQLKDVVNAESSGKGYIFPAIADEIERTYVPKHTDVKGDTWCEGDECEVIFSGRYGLISGYSSDQVLVSFPDGDVWYFPDEIMRIEPDTLERINDDAKMLPTDYCEERGIKVNHDDGFDMRSYCEAMCRDLLKRQRKVLERGNNEL